jgi:hypothetical protein
VAFADKTTQGTLSSISPDLSAFARRGGKLLMYHGWSDPAIAPRGSVNYYSKVLAATTAPGINASWVRLFMVPGMGHYREFSPRFRRLGMSTARAPFARIRRSRATSDRGASTTRHTSCVRRLEPPRVTNELVSPELLRHCSQLVAAVRSLVENEFDTVAGPVVLHPAKRFGHRREAAREVVGDRPI